MTALRPDADLVAAVLAALAVLVLLPPRRDVVDRRVPVLGRPVVAVGSAAVVALVWTSMSATSTVLVAVLAGTCLGVLGVVRRRRAARTAEQNAERVLAACESLASDLGAGQPPLSGLDRVAGEWPELAPVAVAGRVGADVPAVLRELADRPGCTQLRVLAASWAVAHRTGAGLARSVERAADTIRDDRRTARLVASELAAARATARLLAVLPLGVLLLGSGVGGDPVGFLLRSPIGLGCLAVGLGLSVAGLRWLEAIAERVLHP